MIKAGERAPEFTLPDEAAKDRSLTELLSAGAIVLYFYPADFTPGCTRQACVLRDMHTEIESAGLRVVGVSPQSPESHAKFKAKYQLPFVLLSDEQKTVIKMYGVNGPLGLGVRRATYLIDASRRVRDVVLADFKIGRHSEFVRKAVMLRAAPTSSVGDLKDSASIRGE
jgi:peroxiredoxin Q/BCP